MRAADCSESRSAAAMTPRVLASQVSATWALPPVVWVMSTHAASAMSLGGVADLAGRAHGEGEPRLVVPARLHGEVGSPCSSLSGALLVGPHGRRDQQTVRSGSICDQITVERRRRTLKPGDDRVNLTSGQRYTATQLMAHGVVQEQRTLRDSVLGVPRHTAAHP